jgi:hypothetical protein
MDKISYSRARKHPKHDGIRSHPYTEVQRTTVFSPLMQFAHERFETRGSPFASVYGCANGLFFSRLCKSHDINSAKNCMSILDDCIPQPKPYPLPLPGLRSVIRRKPISTTCFSESQFIGPRPHTKP